MAELRQQKPFSVLLIKGGGQYRTAQRECERLTEYSLELVTRMKAQPGIVVARFCHQRKYQRAISALAGFNVNSIERIVVGLK